MNDNYLCELFDLILDITNNIDSIEPQLSKALAELADAYTDNKANKHITDNKSAFSIFTNKDFAIIILSLYATQNLVCSKDNSEYSRARSILDNNLLLKENAKIKGIINADEIDSINFNKIKYLIDSIDMTTTSSLDGADILVDGKDTNELDKILGSNEDDVANNVANNVASNEADSEFDKQSAENRNNTQENLDKQDEKQDDAENSELLKVQKEAAKSFDEANEAQINDIESQIAKINNSNNGNLSEEQSKNIEELYDKLAEIQNKKVKAIENAELKLKAELENKENEKLKEQTNKLLDKSDFGLTDKTLNDFVKTKINKTVEEIVDTLSRIYSEVYKNSVEGIVCHKGLYKLNKDLSISAAGGDKLIANLKLFNYINGECSNSLRSYIPNDNDPDISTDCIDFNDPNYKLIYNYVPKFQAKILYGIYNDGERHSTRNWGKYRTYLVNNITGFITACFKKANLSRFDFKMDGSDAANNMLLDIDNACNKLSISLIELFGNVIIAREFDLNGVVSIRLKVTNIDRLISKLNSDYGAEYIHKELGGISGIPKILSADCIKNRRDIFDIVFTLNHENYKKQVLFSYKILDGLIESGNKVDASSVILGKTPDDANVTYNFNADSAYSTLITGKTRSGKGVLTLNILSILLGSYCPIWYFDFKPDMSQMLWKLEQDLVKRGYTDTKILSIDSAKGGALNSSEAKILSRSDETSDEYKKINLSSRPRRGGKVWYSGDCNPKIKEIENTILIPWVKGIILLCILAFCRASGALGFDAKGPKVMVIFDEAQNFSKSLEYLLEILSKFKEKKKPKDLSPKEAQNEDAVADYQNKLKEYKDALELYNYATKFTEMIESATLGISDFARTSAGSGRCGIITLGQDGQISDWGKQGSVFTYVARNATARIIGRGATNNKYDFNGKQDKIKNISLYNDSDTMGYFALLPSTMGIRPEDYTVFKSSLVLNENDYDLNCYAADTSFGCTEISSEGKFTSSMLRNIRNIEDKQRIIKNDFTVSDANGNIALRDEVSFEGMAKKIGGGNDAFLAERVSEGYNLAYTLLSSLGIIGEDSPFGYTTVEDYLWDGDPRSFFTFLELKKLALRETNIWSLINNNKFAIKGVDDARANTDDKEEDKVSNPNSQSNDSFGFSLDGTPAGDGGFSANQFVNSQIERETNQNSDDVFSLDNEDDSNDKEAILAQEALKRYFIKRGMSEEDATSSVQSLGITQNDQDNQASQDDQDSQSRQVQKTDNSDVNYRTQNTNQAHLKSQESNEQLDNTPDSSETSQETQDNTSNKANADVQRQLNDIRQMIERLSHPESAPVNRTLNYNKLPNGEIVIQNPGKIDRIKLDKNNSIIIGYDKTKLFGRIGSSKLLRTLKGADYELNNRWKAILAVIAQEQDRTLISNVVIRNDILKFQNKMIKIDGILGGEDGVEVADICNFDELAKTFPNIRKLEVGVDIAYSCRKGSEDFPTEMFRKFRKLAKLVIVTPTKSIPFTRETIQMPEIQEEIRKEAAKAALRDGIDLVSLLNNPNRNNNINGVEARRITNKTNNVGGRLADTVRSNIMTGGAWKSSRGARAVIGAGAIAVLTAPLRLTFRLFKKLSG